jgi:hypothetical protein
MSVHMRMIRRFLAAGSENVLESLASIVVDLPRPGRPEREEDKLIARRPEGARFQETAAPRTRRGGHSGSPARQGKGTHRSCRLRIVGVTRRRSDRAGGAFPVRRQLRRPCRLGHGEILRVLAGQCGFCNVLPRRDGGNLSAIRRRRQAAGCLEQVQQHPFAVLGVATSEQARR